MPKIGYNRRHALNRKRGLVTPPTSVPPGTGERTVEDAREVSPESASTSAPAMNPPSAATRVSRARSRSPGSGAKLESASPKPSSRQT